VSLFNRLTEAKSGGASLLRAAKDLEQAAKELRGLAKSHPEYSMTSTAPHSGLYVVTRSGDRIARSAMGGVAAARQIAYDATEGGKSRKALSGK